MNTKALLVVLPLTVVFSGCTFLTDRQQQGMDLLDKAKETASGAVNYSEHIDDLQGMLQRGEGAVDRAVDAVEDTKKRIDTAKEGVDLILEGKSKLEEAIE